MTNGQWVVKNHYSFGNIRYKVVGTAYCEVGYGEYGKKTPYNTRHSGIAVIDWLEDRHEEEILSPEEKRYLATVIKPFRDSIEYIKKQGYYYDESAIAVEQITFSILSDNENYSSIYSLPFFKAGTMYCNMEKSREYSLKELDL